MAGKTPSAKLKAWVALEKLFNELDAKGWPDDEADELDRPTLSAIDTHYTDCAQLAQWRREREG